MTFSRSRRTATLIGGGLALSLVLAACSTDPVADETTSGDSAAESVDESAAGAPEVLTAHGLADMETREIIDTLEQTPLDERPTDMIASIRPNELLVSDASGNETSLPMPEDAFYLSVAPYIEQTHECYYHSLTTCTGELQSAPVSVTVTDATTGDVILEEDMSTQANGFVGMWLPRGIDANLTIDYQGASATTPISTKTDSDATCLTTMQLPQA